MPSELAAAEAAWQAAIARQNELALELDAAGEQLVKAKRTQALNPSMTHLKAVTDLKNQIETLEGQIELATEAISEARGAVTIAKNAQDTAELAALEASEAELQAKLD